MPAPGQLLSPPPPVTIPTVPTLIPISSLDDPRIAPYTRLKERDLSREGGRFIAEGHMVVQRLLGSRFRVESLLVARDRLDAMRPHIPPGTTVHVAEHGLVNRIVGFQFHSGVMAIAFKPPSLSLDDLARTWADQPLTLMVLSEITKTDNLGSLFRIAAGFSVSAVVLGPRCCDPFYRQSVRVSMGAVFTMPIVRSEDLITDLDMLRSRHGFDVAASVLADDAEPLALATRSRRLALVFGNENTGLTPDEVAACNRRVIIPMGSGVDSLNVSVAAAVVLYHFTQVAVPGTS
ncbi:MAG: TrmH family RNA methyltransferase [Tepidisphaerales bacterium]